MPNSVHVHLSGGAPVKGYSSGLTAVQGMSVSSYNSKRELHWDDQRRPGGRRRSVGSIGGVVGAAAAAALLAVVFLLLSCGVSISRNVKATQAWGGRRGLASSEDEGPCEQTATAAAVAAASGTGAGDVEDGEGAGEASADAAIGGVEAADGTGVVSSLNAAAPPFFPRGYAYTGQPAVGETTAVGEDLGESDASSSGVNVSRPRPERSPDGAAAAGEAAADAAAGDLEAADGARLVSSLNEAAPPFFPRGYAYTGEASVEESIAVGEDPSELAASSSGVNVSRPRPERSPDEAAAAGEASADAAAGDVEAADGARVVSSLNEAAPPFFPRGYAFTGQAAAGENTAVGEDLGELAASSSGVNVSRPRPERSPDGAAAAGEAAAQEAVGAGAAGAAAGHEHGQGGRVPLLWPAGPERAVGPTPFLGMYFSRLRQFAAHCADYLREIPLRSALVLAQQLLRYGVVEIATLTPYCTREHEKQRQSAIATFIYFARSLGVPSRAQQQAAPPIYNLMNTLYLLYEKQSFPAATPQARSNVLEEILRPAAAALQHMATAINRVLQSLQGHPPAVPPAVFAAQAAVITAVTEERLLQALSERAASQALQHLQSKVTMGTIFSQADVNLSRQSYYSRVGWKKAQNIKAVAKRANDAFAAALGPDNKHRQPEGAAAGAAAAAAAGTEDATVPQQLVGPELGQQLPEHQIPHGQQQQEHALQEHQPRQQQSPVAQLESPQEGASAATQIPMVEAEEGLDTESANAKARRQAHQQQLQEQAWQGSVRLWQQAGPSPQQQQQHWWRSSPLLQPAEQPGEPWRPYIQQQQPGGGWEYMVFLPPQEQHPSMYVSGFDEAQAGPSRASVGPSGAAADATSLLSPRKSSSQLDSHEQEEAKGSYSEDDAARMKLFKAWSSTASVATPAQAEAADRAAHQQQQQQQQQQQHLPLVASVSFQGTDFPTPSQVPEEAADGGARQQEQQQRPPRSSVDLWSLRDIAGTSRQDILRGPFGAHSSSLQRQASGGDTHQAPAHTPASDSRLPQP